LTAAPPRLHLVFSEPVRLELAALRLVGPDAREVTLGSPSRPVDSVTIVTADVVGTMGSGVYQVEWTAAGRDGHPLHGRFQFTLALPAPDTTTAARDTMAGRPQRDTESVAGNAPRAGLGVESPLYVLVRWLRYGAIVLLVGVPFFRGVVARASAEPTMAGLAPSINAAFRPFSRGAALGVLATAIALLLAQGAVLRSAAPTAARSGVELVLSDPLWLVALLAQVCGALVAMGGPPAAGWGARGWLFTGGALLPAVAPPLTGHAVAMPNAVVGVAFDVMHVIAAGAWFGGLALLSLIALPLARRATLPDGPAPAAGLVRAFTPLALASSGVLLVSGLYAAWIHLGTFQALAGDEYGRMLLRKLVLVAAMAVLGTLNWRLFGPRSATGGLTLRRSARLEFALGVAVLLVTAILVALPTPAAP
jgi:copper transport protein